jgi:outer membrane biosynthesis protein TonB
VLDLGPLAPRTPRLPHQRLGALTQLASTTALHVTLVVIAALIETTLAPGIDARRAEPITNQQTPDVRHLVFLAPELPRTGRGGGGGGNRRPVPIRRAQGVGPKYTSEALANRVQGTVVLEAIVTTDGCASKIRIVRSLDAGASMKRP